MQSIPNRRGARATVGVLVRIALGAVILAFVVRRADPGAATLRWDAGASAGLAAAVALVALAQVLSAARWRLVLGPDDAPPFGRLLRLYLVGQFFSLFLPTSVGGDAVRAVAVSRGARRPAWAVSSVVFERFLGLVTLLAMLAIGGSAAPGVFRASAGRADLGMELGGGRIAIAVVLFLAISIAGVRTMRRSPRVRRAAGEAAALWTGLAARPAAFGAALAASLGVQGAYVAAWMTLGAGLRLPVGWGEMLVFVPFVSLAAMVPVTVAGIGVREGAWALLLAPYGVAAADAVAFSLLYFLAFCLVGAAGGVVFALQGMGRAPSAPGALAAARGARPAA
jgi:uncharacterized membrane protein YbhN (UPF0104 family)